MPRYDDPQVRYDSGHHYDGPPPGTYAPVTTPATVSTTNATTTMEYWEITLNRAQLTRAAWELHLPAFKVGTLGFAALETRIGQFEPLVQQRTAAQDDLDAVFRAQQGTLLKLKTLGTRIPALIEAHLDEDESILRDVRDIYRNQPRSEATILKRARELYGVWLRANTALAALTPPQPALTRTIQSVAYTVVMFKALLDGYTGQVALTNDKQELLDTKRATLRTLEADTDNLSKRWYKAVKNTYDPGSPEYGALAGIPVETGTPAPTTVEIDTITQGGAEGLQALIAYVAGGGDHATILKVKWKVEGVDAGFSNEMVLDFSGNALGPYPVGTILIIITEVTNSSGTRTTAPRTITIEEPIN